MSAEDYPEHLNPFDEHYDGLPPPPPSPPTRRKYNTWGARREHQVHKPTLLDTSWAVLGVSPPSKLVRRLSLLKTTVSRMSFRRKREPLPNQPRSRSIHDDLVFRIISPRVKKRLREQAIPALARLDDNLGETPNIPETECRLSPPTDFETESQDTLQASSPPQVNSPPPTTFPSSECAHGQTLRPQPKPRKKKRPPPPPPPQPPVELLRSTERKAEDNASTKSSLTQDLEKGAPSEDNASTKSSITQDLEKGALSEDNDSLAEFEFDQLKLNQQYD